jgi:hypothetical protein
MNTSLLTIEAALKRAAQTLKHLPHRTFAGYASYWPDVVRSTPESWLARPYQRSRPHINTAQEISAMDEVLNWLFILKREERRIVWARACQIPWRALEDQDGRSHVTLRKIHTNALKSIALALEEDITPLGVDETGPASRFRVQSFHQASSPRLRAASARMRVI